MYSIKMMPRSTPYRCRMCSAATYFRVVHRGEDGAMTYSGLYRCSGCDLTFVDPTDWRHAPTSEGLSVVSQDQSPSDVATHPLAGYAAGDTSKSASR